MSNNWVDITNRLSIDPHNKKTLVLCLPAWEAHMAVKRLRCFNHNALCPLPTVVLESSSFRYAPTQCSVHKSLSRIMKGCPHCLAQGKALKYTSLKKRSGAHKGLSEQTTGIRATTPTPAHDSRTAHPKIHNVSLLDLLLHRERSLGGELCAEAEDGRGGRGETGTRGQRISIDTCQPQREALPRWKNK